MKDVDTSSFADDSTTYLSANDNTSLVKTLEDSACSIFKWFKNNQMQGNAGKCHVLLSTNEKIVIKVDSAEIENSQSQKLLGVTMNLLDELTSYVGKIFKIDCNFAIGFLKILP